MNSTLDEELRLHETVLDAGFAIDRNRAGRLQVDDFSVAKLRRMLARFLQLSVNARLAHSACFAAVALQEVMTAGRTFEVRAGHPMAV